MLLRRHISGVIAAGVVTTLLCRLFKPCCEPILLSLIPFVGIK